MIGTCGMSSGQRAVLMSGLFANFLAADAGPEFIVKLLIDPGQIYKSYCSTRVPFPNSLIVFPKTIVTMIHV